MYEHADIHLVELLARDDMEVVLMMSEHGSVEISEMFVPNQ